MPLEEGDTFFFAPRALRNLVMVDELDSLSPILACQVADLGNLPLFKTIKLLYQSYLYNAMIIHFQLMRTPLSCTCCVEGDLAQLYEFCAMVWKFRKWPNQNFLEIQVQCGQ